MTLKMDSPFSCKPFLDRTLSPMYQSVTHLVLVLCLIYLNPLKSCKIIKYIIEKSQKFHIQLLSAIYIQNYVLSKQAKLELFIDFL